MMRQEGYVNTTSKKNVAANKNNTEQPKSNIKNLIIILTIAIGMYFLIPKLVGVEQALVLLSRVNKFYVLIAVIAEIVSYCGAAWLLGIILSRLGYKIPFFDRFRLGSIAAFAIHFFPVGSFGQGAVDYYFLRKRNVNSGSILILLLLRVIVTYAAFLIVFMISLVLVPTVPHLLFSPKIISIILLLMILSGSFYLYFLYKNKEQFLKVWRGLVGVGNFFSLHILKRKISTPESLEIFDDVHSGIGLFTGKKRASVLAVLAGMIYWLGDIACLYFAFLSFDFVIHPSILIFSYCVSTLAGLISFIPGGIGVTEGTLGLLLKGFGIKFSLSIMAILLFRLFSFWIWIPFGFYSYMSLRKEQNGNN